MVDIAPILGLSDSTVSQHLIELKKMRVIEEMEDGHFKNMKYYRLKNGNGKYYSNNKGNRSPRMGFILKAIVKRFRRSRIPKYGNLDKGFTELSWTSYH